jgi:hypothetical protein
MAKMYAGNIPDEKEGWSKMASMKDADQVEWLLFVKRQEHSPDWCNIKIVANGKAQSKANYWMGKNMNTGQIAFARDYAILRENRPELHSQMEDVFKRLKTQ